MSFDHGYLSQPKNSPLFGKANEFGILKRDTWPTEISDFVDYRKEEDIFITKERVSSFFGTNLESLLRNMNITDVYVAGVSTDLAVESCVRDAHDRDFSVTVIESACAAASLEDHQKSINTLKKIATVI